MPWLFPAATPALSRLRTKVNGTVSPLRISCSQWKLATSFSTNRIWNSRNVCAFMLLMKPSMTLSDLNRTVTMPIFVDLTARLAFQVTGLIHQTACAHFGDGAFVTRVFDRLRSHPFAKALCALAKRNACLEGEFVANLRHVREVVANVTQPEIACDVQFTGGTVDLLQGRGNFEHAGRDAGTDVVGGLLDVLGI